MVENMKFWQLTAVASCALSMGAILVEVRQAQAFGFQDTTEGRIEMFNDNGEQIGTGNFTYSPFVGRFVGERVGLRAPLYENPNDPLPLPPKGPSGQTYRPPAGYNVVTAISLRFAFGGSTITIPDFYNVPTRTGQVLGSQSLFFFNAPSDTTVVPPSNSDLFLTLSGGDPRSPSLITRDGWSGCLPVCGITQRAEYNFRENGSWSYFDATAPSSSAGISGTFRLTALADSSTAIPEPTTIAGMFIAGSLGFWAKRRQARQQTAA